MEQRTCNGYVIRTAGRRPRILIEDDRLDPVTLDLSPPGCSAFEIVTCTGPVGSEGCPLVVGTGCPTGRPDVVVSALRPENPWHDCVRRAWAAEGVRVVEAGDDGALRWPNHLGAAITALLGADAPD